MRGRALCRSHRNHELGSGPVGAPKGNFNALKNAVYAQLLAPEQLGDLAYQIAQDPYHFDRHLSSVVKEIHRRAGRDPLNTLLLVGALVKQLLDPVASAIFNQQLAAYLDQLPDHARAGFQDILWKHAMPLSPADRVVYLRGIAAKLPPDKIRSANESILENCEELSVAQPNSPKLRAEQRSAAQSAMDLCARPGFSRSELRAGLRPAVQSAMDVCAANSELNAVQSKSTGKQSAEKQSTGDTREKTLSDPADLPLTLLLNRLLESK
jgi:hypothetical protein